MPIPKARKKPVRLPRRKIAGAEAAPLDKGFRACADYFHLDVDKKQLSEITKGYVKQEFSKEDSKAILANPEYHFTMYTHWAAAIWWQNKELDFGEQQGYKNKLRNHYEKLIEPGLKILAEKKKNTEQEAAKKVIRLTPQQLMARKVAETIMADLDELEDAWIMGEKKSIDVYALFKKYELKSFAVPTVKERVEGWKIDYGDAYEKTCEQAVEAFSHVKRPELKRRLKCIDEMLSDLQRVVVAGKANRKPRVKKARAADKQVKDLKYMKEDKDLKIVSVNPMAIVGSMRLLVVNSKYRTITEYICARREGFEIKGTTLQHWDVDQSRTKTMRKPDEFIPICQKTIRQFGKAFEALTTKETKPTGRLNADCVLLKVDT